MPFTCGEVSPKPGAGVLHCLYTNFKYPPLESGVASLARAMLPSDKRQDERKRPQVASGEVLDWILGKIPLLKEW